MRKASAILYRFRGYILALFAIALIAYENKCYLQFGSTHNFEFKFRKFLLNISREEQIGLYRVLQGFALSGYKKSAFLKTPLQSTKYLWKFLRFKG